MIISWRQLYARPLFRSESVERATKLYEQGAERLGDRALIDGMVWRPYWRRRDGRLRGRR